MNIHCPFIAELAKIRLDFLPTTTLEFPLIYDLTWHNASSADVAGDTEPSAESTDNVCGFDFNHPGQLSGTYFKLRRLKNEMISKNLIVNFLFLSFI